MFPRRPRPNRSPFNKNLQEIRQVYQASIDDHNTFDNIKDVRSFFKIKNQMGILETCSFNFYGTVIANDKYPFAGGFTLEVVDYSFVSEYQDVIFMLDDMGVFLGCQFKLYITARFADGFTMEHFKIGRQIFIENIVELNFMDHLGQHNDLFLRGSVRNLDHVHYPFILYENIQQTLKHDKKKKEKDSSNITGKKSNKKDDDNDENKSHKKNRSFFNKE